MLTPTDLSYLPCGTTDDGSSANSSAIGHPLPDHQTLSETWLQTGSECGSLRIGAMVENRYRVLARLGKGGMGDVYRVEQVFLKKQFALKAFRPLSTTPRALMRFQKEAQAASRLSHINLVQATDFGMIEGIRPFFVMELVDGFTLKEHLNKVGRLDYQEALELFIALCSGMSHAHQSGVVHRDIKPENILLIPEQNRQNKLIPKVVDFGIAKLGADAQGLTDTGELVGTPLYMSPEQCSSQLVDRRSDIYSLGCVLFETLTGTPPFQSAAPLETMMQHLCDPPPSLKEASLGTEFPQGLEKVVAKMLCKEPEERHQDCAELAQDLEFVLLGQQPEIGPSDRRSVRQCPKRVQKMSAWKSRTFDAVKLVTLIALTMIFCWLAFHRTLVQQSADVQSASPGSSAVREAAAPSSQDLTVTALLKDFDLADTEVLSINGDTVLNKQLAQDPEAVVEIPPYYNITDNGLQGLLKRSQIEELRLSGKSRLTSACVRFFHHLPLRALDMSGTALDKTGLADICTHMHASLRDLNVSRTQLNGNDLDCLDQLTQLTTLDLSGIKGHGDLGINARGMEAISKLNSVQFLDISYSCMSDEAAAALEHMRQLKELNAEGCCHLKDRGMKSIGRLCHLSALNLTGCASLDDQSLGFLRNLRHLQQLNLANLPISDAGLRRLNFPHLESLSLKNCSKITDRSLKQLTAMHNLVNLDLGSTAITDRGLPTLYSLQELRTLRLSGCSRVTRGAAMRMKAVMPYLDIQG